MPQTSPPLLSTTENDAGPAPVPAESDIRAMLRESGDFLLRTSPGGEAELWHYARSGELINTAIQRDQNGLFIDRWNAQDRRFSDEAALYRFLAEEIRLYDARQYALLQAWVQAAPDELEGAWRGEVARVFREAYRDQEEVNLTFSHISSLPPSMPRRVQNLSILRCPSLREIPSNLPDGLLSFTMDGAYVLTEFPALPGSVTSVRVSNSPLIPRLSPLPHRLHWLELSNLTALTLVPGLPGNLAFLQIEGSPALTSLPALPLRLQALSLLGCAALTGLNATQTSLVMLELAGCRSLTTLSALPETLTILDLGDCSGLTRLPELPVNLVSLDLGGCSGLAELPLLPAGITSLKLNGCSGLTCLPAIPSGLDELTLSGCRGLTTLPALPAGLRVLNLKDCSGLIALPVLPDSLQELNLNGCSALMRLPEQRPAGLLRLALDGCTALASNVPDWARGVEPVEERLPIAGGQSPVEYWAQRAGLDPARIKALKQDWQRLSLEEGAAHFETLLQRLGELDGDFSALPASQVMAVIDEVMLTPEGRGIIFAAAWDADRNCHDRPLLRFNDIQAIARGQQLMRLGAGQEALLELARGMARQALLDSVAGAVMLKQWNEKVSENLPLADGNRRRANNATGSGPNTEEGLEVQLGLRVKLGKTLGLPFEARARYIEMAGLNQSDLAFARAQVERRLAEPLSEVEGVMAQPVWQQYLERQSAATLAAVSAPYAEEGAALEEMQNALPEAERMPDEIFVARFNEIGARRQAAIDAVLRRMTAEALHESENSQRVRAFYTDYQARLRRLCERVQAYLDKHPGSGRVSALRALAEQLQPVLTDLATEMKLPSDERRLLALRFTRANPALPAVAQLKQQAEVTGKRIGPSYRAILDDLIALHARRLILPAPPPLTMAHERERLLSWRAVRARAAPGFAEAGGRLGAQVRHAPQAIWLGTDARTEYRGRCTGLALAWALDPASDTLFDNVFSAAAHPDDPAALAFRTAIDDLHRTGNGESMTRLAGVSSWDQAVDTLEQQRGQRALLIHVGNHSIALAAQGEGGDIRYAFFDPNAGVWRNIAGAGALKQALTAYFTPALQQHYAFAGKIEAYVVRQPGGLWAGHALWLRTRAPLRPSAPPGESSARGALAMAGTGMRLYGSYRALLAVEDYLKQGRRDAVVFELGNLAAIWLAEGVERGLARQAVPAQRMLTRAAGELLMQAPSLIRQLPASLAAVQGRLLMAFSNVVAAGPALLLRSAGIAGQLLTLPFDLYRAITSFRQAGELSGLDRQDALVSGGMATLGAATGVMLAGAVFAGASLSVIGPLGLALGIMMMAAGKIYQAVRQVQEVERFITLTPGQKWHLGLRFFRGEGIDEDSNRAVHQVRYNALLRANAERTLTGPAGQSVGLVLYPDQTIESRALADTCNDDHAHDHVALAGHQSNRRKLWGGKLAPPPADPARRCPKFAPGHRHALRRGYELLVRPTDDRVDLAGAPVNAVTRAPAGAQPATAGDDVFTLDQLSASGAPPLSFDGGAGDDSLLLEPLLADSACAGVLIDLESGMVAALGHDGGQMRIGRISAIENLYSRPALLGAGVSRHQLYGDRRANLLAGAGRDRLYGRAGDDVLLLSASAFADGGAGNDLYLVETLLAGDHVTIVDGGEDERNLIYLGMDHDQIAGAEIIDQALVLSFRCGAKLTLLTPVEYPDSHPAWVTYPGRFAWLTRDGWLLQPVLAQGAVTLRMRYEPGALASLLAALPVQRLARLMLRTDQSALFNYGDGNDVLTGHVRRKNLFNLGSGNKTVTGGMRDDVFVLNAAAMLAPSGIEAYDLATRRSRARQIGAWRYRLEGGEGNDTLRIDTPVADSGYLGYRIDLAARRIALTMRDSAETVELGELSAIENLVVSTDALRDADTRHVLLGDERSNLLTGCGLDELDGRAGDDVLSVSGQARAFGGSGNDTFYLSGSAFADGGDGQDSYYIDHLLVGDRVTLHDSGVALSSGSNDSMVRFNFGIQQIVGWQLTGNDLVLTLQSGATITVKSFVQPGLPVQMRFLTREGYLLSPELPAAPGGDLRIVVRYLSAADALSDANGQGVTIDLQKREIGVWPSAQHPLLVLDSRYRLMGVGTAYPDRLTGAADAEEGQILRGYGGDDCLTAVAGGTLMRGDDGADRYRVALADSLQGAGEAVYLDNDADDGVDDTLQIATVHPDTRLRLARMDDDLLLAVTPDNAAAVAPPSVVVLGYFRQAERRHLALELCASGGVMERVSASELEVRALSEGMATSTAGVVWLERMIERMASFESGAGGGATLTPAPQSPVGWLAA